MTLEQMLIEIKMLKSKIAALPEGSCAIGELTVAIVMLYDSYVTKAESNNRKKVA